MSGKLYTLKEVADLKLLDYTFATLSKMVQTGDLPVVDIARKGALKRRIRISQEIINNLCYTNNPYVKRIKKS